MTTETPETDTDQDTATDKPEADRPQVSEPDAETPNSEAAKYRRRLRDTETERDQMRGQLDAMRRQAAQTVATGLADPTDLWRFDITVTDILSDDGNTIDPVKVAAAVDTLLADRPHLAPRPVRPSGGRPVEQLHPGASSRPVQPTQATWQETLRGAK